MQKSSKYIKPKTKILLIDDDEFFGSVMRVVAESYGLDLEHFDSIERLGRVGAFSRYDLILLDYWMPDFNGRELAEYVTAFCPKLPVILISSDSKMLEEEVKWPIGVMASLSKGIGPNCILAEVFSYINKSRYLSYNQGKRGGRYKDNIDY